MIFFYGKLCVITRYYVTNVRILLNYAETTKLLGRLIKNEYRLCLDLNGLETLAAAKRQSCYAYSIVYSKL